VCGGGGVGWVCGCVSVCGGVGPRCTVIRREEEEEEEEEDLFEFNDTTGKPHRRTTHFTTVTASVWLP
jgi:hypothetical protein